MNGVFDAGAKAFANDIDTAIKDGAYRRGDLFLGFATQYLRPGGLVLDYGCGPGRISLFLARSGFEVIGVDSSEAMIEQAKKQNMQGLRVQFRVGN